MADFVSKEKAVSRLNELIAEISRDGTPCYITEGGRARAVLLDVDRYHALMDAVEGMHGSGPAAGDAVLIEQLIHSESRKRKKSIRYFGVNTGEID